MEYLIDLLLDFYGPVPYIMVFGILLICGFGVPIPEDIVLFAGGVMAYYGVSSLTWMVVICLLGVLVGDSIMFFLGYKYGRRLTRNRIFHKLLPDERLEKVSKQLNEKGNKLLFAARFMPGLRAPIFFTAGALHIPYRKFLLFDGLAALISVPAIVITVYWFGDTLDRVIAVIKRVEHGIVFVIFGAIALFAFKWFWKRRKERKAAATSLALLIATGLGVNSTAFAEATTKQEAKPQTTEQLCQELRRSFTSLKWTLDPCGGTEWKVGGHSVQGRPLIYAEFGDKASKNTTLVLSMVHGDEVTPLYLALQLVRWLETNRATLTDTRVVVAPLVNPDSYFSRPRKRVNARGVDVNRNFATKDWSKSALQKWKTRFGSNPRRFPGHQPNSEPETIFQVDLIEQIQPQKILSIHAPLNYLDYDGPNMLALNRFSKTYVQECLKLRRQLKAVHGQFFPGSLGNYSGQERGIPTITLELPSANPRNAKGYWGKFQTGITSMIDFRVPADQAILAPAPSPSPVQPKNLPPVSAVELPSAEPRKADSFWSKFQAWLPSTVNFKAPAKQPNLMPAPSPSPVQPKHLRP